MLDKVVLVTGASRGIGAATAHILGRQGYKVAVNYNSQKQAAQAVCQQIIESGSHAVAISADVSKETDVRAMFGQIKNELGEITALVNNAGMLEPQMTLAEMSVERLDRTFAVNVRGSFLCAREAVRSMSTNRGGSGGAIVNVSSRAASLGSPNEYIDYAASKGAVDTMTIGLAKEVADEGIRVNAVRPGFIDTEMHASGGEPDRLARLAPVIPMQRGGQPEEVASAIAWLLSDEASYCTGTFIDIAGGR